MYRINVKYYKSVWICFEEEKQVHILPRWIEYNSLPRNNEWASFVDLVKNNSEKIFSKVIQVNIYKDILSKDEKWMKDNKAFLSKEEISFLETIDVLSKNDLKTGVIDLNNFELSDDNNQRIEFLFNELENLIDEQKKELLKIKEITKYKAKQ